MKNPDMLTIAIISYNSYEVICRCLSDLISDDIYKIIVVDNASEDGSGTRISERFPSVELIQAKSNLGYGRAANLAIAAARSPYLLLINPDIPATSATVSELLSHTLASQPDVALTAPAVTKKDFVQQGAQEREWVIGAAMMFNLERLKPVGGFDENIFLFYEETDLCLRIKKAGLRILLDSDVYIEHLYRQSSTPSPVTENLKNWHFAWSSLYFRNKHGLGTGKKNPYRIATQYFGKYVLALKREKRALYWARFRGAVAFCRNKGAFNASGNPRR